MKSKERVLGAIKKEELDYVPICPPFQAYWALNFSNITIAESIKNPKLSAKAQMKVIRRCDFDAFEVMWDWLAPVEAMGCEVKITDIDSPFTVSGIISDQDSLDKLEFPDPRDDYRIKSAMQTAEYLIDKFGKDKFLYCTLIAPFSLAGELRGLEFFLRECYKNPSLVTNILNFTTEVLKNYYEYMISLDVDGIFICDPSASGSLISKQIFNLFAKPYIKQIINVIKEADKNVLLHICGDVSDRLESIMEIEHDVLSLDTLVDLEYARKVLGKKITILGNISTATTLFLGTQEQVKKEANSCIKKTGGIGHILGGDCGISPGTFIENIAIWKNVVKRNE